MKKKAYEGNVCEQMRDSLAKNLYNNMFKWLIKRINGQIGTPDLESKEATLVISLIDTPGFETYKNANSFDQLLINYTDEHILN